MTLSTTTVRATIPGSGSAGPFVYPMKVFAATDLLVQKTSVTGVVSVLNYPTDYTVTGVGNASGGTLTLTVALAVGESLSILRAVPNTQPTSFRSLGTFFPASHEDEFDRLTMLVQQNTDAIKRSVRLASSIDPAVFTTELPVPVANQALVAKSDGTGWEARTIDTASASLLPSGRTATSLTAYLANNAVFNVLDFGASPSATAATNAAAFAAAAAAAGSTGLLYFPSGYTFSSNGNLVITGPCMGRGCTINWSGTGDAIAVGAFYSGSGGLPLVQNVTIELPLIANANKTVTGWAQSGVASSVGVRVRHLYNSRLTVPWVRNFESGIVMYGEHDGCDYNEVHIGHLSNNKRNVVMDSTTDGWTNENQFITGRLAHDTGEGSLISGARQILILGNVGGVVDIFNNHKFRGLAFEGDVPEYEIETHGSDSLWDQCRWERATGNAKFLSSGTAAISNTIRGGFNSHLVQCTTASGAAQPRVEHRDRLTLAGTSSGSVLALINQNSSASPIVRAYNAGQDPYAASADTNWVWQLWAQGLQGKQSTDAVGVKRLFLDPTTGFGTFAKLIGNLVDSGGGTVAVADAGGTATLMTGFATGLVIVEDTNTGQSAFIWIGTSSAILGGGATNFSLTQGTATHYNVYTSGGNLIFENRRGAGAAAVAYMVFRLI